ncbi:hypothetical protein PACTADRAFT_49945 [Pachysolen tannophilus NRRL Y-2460]|uniref:Major facilitator superfamily (MFS) profile domain-containing protein n=1 Tax=Pachysolen tannophilus NRRL Y-2460 TaxID=669874 RepID=A0A1E4TU07_PACTA|nr:hypothetical protein PACTADRAFT_49945 [Pachysolen tannophilus NRRL Y-2460]
MNNLESGSRRKNSLEDSHIEDQNNSNGNNTTNSNVVKKPDFSARAIKHYFATRFPELIPSKEIFHENKQMLNPFPALKKIPGKQWLLMSAGFWAWTWDAFDYFSVSLNVSKLASDFDVSTTDITWGITLVLMLRTVGALIFGFAGDRYGRKWALVVNLICMCILEIGTGFIKTYRQFLGIRACFGVIMGGVYGNAAATVLDDCPVDAKGFLSGLLQQGYAFGYLLAVVFTRAIADTTSKSWRALFWFAAGICFLIIIFRSILPETTAFKKKIAFAKYQKNHNIAQLTFKEKALVSLKIYWLMMIYMVLLMAGFNFMSHGSQDLFPTFLTKQLNFGDNRSTVTNCVANFGALTGGVVVGHFSNFVGRRLSVIICCIIGGALIYPWAFVTNNGIDAAVFFLQFMVQGAWGVIPIHLSELCPPEFRSLIVGLAYQLGNLASSASSTIETRIGERFPMTNEEGVEIYDYGKVMAIFMGCVFGYVLLMTFLGPEHRGASLVRQLEKDGEEKEIIAEVNDQELLLQEKRNSISSTPDTESSNKELDEDAQKLDATKSDVDV